MIFRPVTPKVDIQELELDILRFWRDNDIFHKSMELRKSGPTYVFYEGPPTANGKPGSHHVLSRAFKDIFPRYRAMQGNYVLRRGGWDTHGLPVEIEVEKELGLTGKDQIEEYGIAEFNSRCRQSVFEYIQDWERLTDRIGYWVDLETAYVTYENDYIESVWWILKQLWDKGLIYQGFKVVPYCARCGTPLSDHEVALGYEENTEDPSIYVRLRLVDEEETSLLVWTTTPWTLPANVAVAVHPEITYVTVEINSASNGTERLILAKDLIASVLGTHSYRIVSEQLGVHLAGRHYEPLFEYLPVTVDAHYVVTADFVTMTEGTGIVHQAPAFGIEDMDLARDHDLPILMTVDERGCFVEEVEPWSGVWVKDADPLITQELKDRGLLFKSSTCRHTYPFCWRCGTPLLYYARDTWYIETTRLKDQLLNLNQQVNWYPGHIKNGRFGNWLENNVDWALGRERYWGTPLPIWLDEAGDAMMVGSVSELSELTGRDLSSLDLHRPFVDEITFSNPKTGNLMRRVPELTDVWFDSGAMPVAQWHYPFENRETFRKQFPADYICEAVDQTRGWFYSLHAIATLVFEKACFRNCVCLGLILDGEGQKMSKSRGNIVDPWDVIQAHGADAFRWYLYTGSPPGQERLFSVDLVGDVVRNFTLTLWNAYSFFVTYANLDGWSPDHTDSVDTAVTIPPLRTDMDKWILSELHTLVRDVTRAFENYDANGGTRPIERFVHVLSNWYIRRSRRRFWKSEDDGDKLAAYATLYECLVTVSKILAPSAPFIADVMYRNLVISVSPNSPESVHLTDWLAWKPDCIDEQLNKDMRMVQQLVSLGHSARHRTGLRVRQPLAEAAFWAGGRTEAAIISRYAVLIADELNVKQVRTLDSMTEAISYALHPLPRQLGQKHGKRFPKIKAALLALNASEAARTFLDGESIILELDGEGVEVLPDEVEVRLTAREGFAVSEEGGLIAALVTELTPELLREGLAREVVRRVQDLRKSKGLDIADRVHVKYSASGELSRAVEEQRQYIMGEILALSFHESAEVSGEEYELESERFVIDLQKA